jgi:hypothetical protein
VPRRDRKFRPEVAVTERNLRPGPTGSCARKLCRNSRATPDPGWVPVTGARAMGSGTEVVVGTRPEIEQMLRGGRAGSGLMVLSRPARVPGTEDQWAIAVRPAFQAAGPAVTRRAMLWLFAVAVAGLAASVAVVVWIAARPAAVFAAVLVLGLIWSSAKRKRRR